MLTVENANVRQRQSMELSIKQNKPGSINRKQQNYFSLYMDTVTVIMQLKSPSNRNGKKKKKFSGEFLQVVFRS